MNYFFSMSEEIVIIQTDELLHSSFKPLLQSDLEEIDLSEAYSIDTSYFLTSLKRRKAEGSWLKRKLFHEHLFVVDENNFYLTLDPIFDFSFGKDMQAEDDKLLYKNMRGFLLRADIAENVSIQSVFRENQARYANFVSEQLYHGGDALGQGKARELDDGGYDFSMASAYVSYSPSQKVNLQIGHGKHFVGNGVQSHFLSDRPYNYPFLRANTSWLNNKLNYTNLFTSMQELKRLPYADREGLLYRKTGNFIFMDFAVSSNLYLGLFEGRLWETTDTTTGEKVLPPSAFIPVFGVNTLIEGLGNKKSNGMIGLNARWDVKSSVQLYAQGAMHAKNDISGQFGLKYIPVDNLLLQLEYNQRSMDSAKVENTEITYSHYSRGLGFDKEMQLIFSADYRYKRWLLDTEFSYFSITGEDFLHTDLNLGFLINPATNFSCNFGLFQRLRMEEKEKSRIFYISLRTNLQNIFYDI